MKILFIDRTVNLQEVSIERLFSTIRIEIAKRNILFDILKNPNKLSPVGILKSLFFFFKRQRKLNHITGDIHWVALSLSANTTVLTIHDLVGLTRLSGFKKQLYFFIWYYLPIKKLKYITTISEKIKEDLVKLIPSAEKKIRVIKNCVTVELAPKKYKEGLKKVLVIGTRENKNIERILESLENIDVSLTVVGKLTLAHIGLIKKFRLDVENLTDVTDQEIIELYDTHDILCFPSLYEGFGLPILEAQARSCVVMTSSLLPMMQVAGDGALLVDPMDVNDIALGFQKLIGNMALANELIDKGYENVKKYSPEEVAGCYIELYKEILKNGTN